MADQTPPLPRYAGATYFRVTSPSPFVAHVEINRPTKLNAFVEAMWLELGRVFDGLSADPDVRAVVLSGAGDRAFTAGLDVQEASKPGGTLDMGNSNDPPPDPARAAARLRRHIEEFQNCISSVEKCEKREWRETLAHNEPPPRHGPTWLAYCFP